MSLRGKRGTGVFCAVLLAMLLSAAAFCPIPAETAYASSTELPLYILQTAMDRETATAYVYVGFTGAEEARLESTADYFSSSVKDGAWYFRVNREYSFPYAKLFSEAEEKIAQYGLLPQDAQYSELKIVAVYDTIYKRLQSNGNVVASGKYRSHRLELEENNRTLKINLSTPNTANWYTVLAASGLAVFAIAAAVALAIKGNGSEKRK